MPRTSRGNEAVFWVEAFCVAPSSVEKGQRVRLSPVAGDRVPDYDDPSGSKAVPLTGGEASRPARYHQAEQLRRPRRLR
jgi:hypothetical protein